jgi:uncharacterized DUF497 family protein
MFEWDEQKRRGNLQKQGFDFRRIVGAFDSDQRVVFRDRKQDYGEERLILLCPVNGVYDTRRCDPHHLGETGQQAGTADL